MIKEAYPLQWPAGWKRTRSPAPSRFKSDMSFGRIRDGLFAEVSRMGGSHAVLSTNIPLTKDGVPYAKHRQPEDVGAAIYFQRKGKPVVLACDAWQTVGENVRALQLSVEAMRSLERWGSSEILERSFTGFTALPPPPGMEVLPPRSWRDILDYNKTYRPNKESLRERRNHLLRYHHPDVGASPDAEKSALINRAYGQACLELGY